MKSLGRGDMVTNPGFVISRFLVAIAAAAAVATSTAATTAVATAATTTAAAVTTTAAAAAAPGPGPLFPRPGLVDRHTVPGIGYR